MMLLIGSVSLSMMLLIRSGSLSMMILIRSGSLSAMLLVSTSVVPKRAIFFFLSFTMKKKMRRGLYTDFNSKHP